MAKVKVEFINTCPCCVGYEEYIKEVAARYPDEVEVKIYHAGKDFDYLPLYGPVTKGTLIINGTKKYDKLNKETIEKAIAEAVGK
ncbi:MAG: thioredoxin-like (seleno)protein SaoT [Thermoanaerobacterales bacterium]|nr:thioredoxin-like (seleno)protein SaoT [Thermoanaerobacterales bacterium]